MALPPPVVVPARVVVSDRATVADDATRLTHDAYVLQGFQQPSASGRRFIAPYLNPGTRFAVVYSGDEAIASAALVPDGPFGLPADRAFVEELDDVRHQATTCSEVSGLAFAPRWRKRARDALWLLLGTALRMNSRSRPGHRLVYVMPPRQMAVVEQLLVAERCIGPRPLHGAPGTLVVTRDMSQCRQFFSDPNAPAARDVLGRFVLDTDPSWLVDEPPMGEWRRDLATHLPEATAVRERIEAQLALSSGAESIRAAVANSAAPL